MPATRGTSRAGAALEKALDERLADAALRWGSCCDKGSWRDHVAEHGDTARQLEILAERAVEVVSRKGHPARGGPARARVKSALTTQRAAEALTCLVGSSSKAAASVACHSLDRLTGILAASENSTILRACASQLLVPLIHKACQDYRDDTKAALAAATALWRLLGTPKFSPATPALSTLVTTATAAEREAFELVARTLDAVRATDVASSCSSDGKVVRYPEVLRRSVCRRMIDNATRGDGKGPSNAPLAVVAAALAPHSQLWTEALTDRMGTAQKFAQRLMECATMDEGVVTTLGTEAALEAAAMLARDVPVFREGLIDIISGDVDAALGAHLCGSRERPAEVAALHLLTAMAPSVSPRILKSSQSSRRRGYSSDSDDDERVEVNGVEWTAILDAVLKRASEFPSVIQSRLQNRSDEAKEVAPAAAITAVAELLTVAPWKLGERGPGDSGWQKALMKMNIDHTLEACLKTLSEGVRKVTSSGRAMSSLFRRGEAVTTAVIDALHATERLIMYRNAANMFDEIADRGSNFRDRKPALPSPKLRWEELLNYAMNILMIAGPMFMGSYKEDGTFNYEDIRTLPGPPYDNCAWKYFMQEHFGTYGVGDIFEGLWDPELIATAGNGARDWMAESMATAAGSLLCTAMVRNIEWLEAATPRLDLIQGNHPAFGGTNMERGLHYALSMDWPWKYLSRLDNVNSQAMKVLGHVNSIPRALLAALVSLFMVHDEKLLHAEQIMNEVIPYLVDLVDPTLQTVADVDIYPLRGVQEVDAVAENDEGIDGPLRWSFHDLEFMVAWLRMYVMLFSVYRNVPKVEDPVKIRSLRQTFELLASEDGGLGDEGRCWAIKALNLHVVRYDEKDLAPMSTDEDRIRGPRSRVADALLAALPEPFRHDDGDDDDDPTRIDRDAAMKSSPVAPPDVCFCLADGWRLCAHSAILSARCPVLARKIEDLGSEPPAGGIRAVKMGAQVTVEGLRRALAWMYSSRVIGPIPEPLVLSLRLPELRRRTTFPGIGCVAGSLVRDLDAAIPHSRGCLRRSLRPRPFPGPRPPPTDLTIRARASEAEHPSRRAPPSIGTHRVVLCARSEYCRAALSVAHGFAESGGTNASLTLPLTTRLALEMFVRVVYLGEIPAVPEPVPIDEDDDEEEEGEEGEDDEEEGDGEGEEGDGEEEGRRGLVGWARALVELGGCLEYVGLPEEAARCTPRLRRALADWDDACAGRKRSVSAAGAINALATAVELRRWDDVDALAGALVGAYPEVCGKASFEALHPELREAMRRAHVDARHAGVAYRG